MFQRPKRIVYGVVDLERARNWYAGLLGSEPAFESHLAAVFKIGENTLSLARSGIAGCPAVYWEVEDVDEAYARLLQLGAAGTCVPKDVLNTRIAQVVDPFGNALGLTGKIPGDSEGTVEKQPSRTAHSVALCRALAGRDPRFAARMSDPYAELFLDDSVRPVLADEAARERVIDAVISRPLYGYLIARTAFVDQALLQALEGGISQIVLLGAGYDTRSLRFQDRLGGAKVFELDAPSTQNRKLEALSAARLEVPSAVRFVRVNFKNENFADRLLQSGYDTSSPAFFLWEGVTYYLSPETVESSMQRLRDISASGSGLCFDYMTSKRDSANAGEPFLSWMDPDTVEGFIGGFGFCLLEHLDAAQMRERFLSLPGGPAAERPLPVLRLVYAERV